MSGRPRLLIVDADAEAGVGLASVLQTAGFATTRAEDGEHGLALLKDAPPDALIIDLDLPDADGRAVLSQARGFFHRPILILSARGATADKVQALDLGADDYLQKPVDPDELLARLRAATRNKLTREGAGLIIRSHGVEIDMRRRIVLRDTVEVHLSSREYNLLVELARSVGKVVTHRQLLTAVWGPERALNVEYLRVFIQQLRQKLEQDPTTPRLILTETGVGYRFME